MDVESVQVHVEAEAACAVGSSTPATPSIVSELSTSAPSVWATPASFVEAGATEVARSTLTPGTPSNELSGTSASTPLLWTTPATFAEPEKVPVYSFREIISMPSLKITDVTNGEISGGESATEKMNGFVETQTPEELRTAVNGVLVIPNPVVTNGVLQDTSVNANGNCDSIKPIIEYNLSPVSSHMAVPPNTPQVLVGDDSNLSILSPEEIDLTVYEKTPFGAELKGHSRSSSGMKIVGAIEKTHADSTPKKNGKTDSIAVEKCTSKTYIVPESKPVAEELVKGSVEVMSVMTPSLPTITLIATPLLEAQRPVDAIDGPTEPTARGVAVNIPNGRSQSNIDGFTRGSDRMAMEGPDCEELLGGCLVRPCPSMRPFRKRFAKGFLVGFLVITVAFIVLMIIINRRSISN